METIPRTIYEYNGHAAPTVIPQGPAMLPEAPCSITLRVPMPGYTDHALITGRGQTGGEAAAQWQSARDGLLAVLAPPSLPSREEQLSQLLACGVLKAVQRGYMPLVERLTKGCVLAVKGLVEPTDLPQMLTVRSQTDSDTWYTVNDNGACSCPDWGKHREDARYRCKHGLASLFYRRIAPGDHPWSAT